MYCSKCGQEIENNADFCSHCGASVSEAPKKGKKKSKKPIFKRWWFWAIVFVIIIGLSGGGDESESEPTTPPETTAFPATDSPATLNEAFTNMQAGIADLEEASTARVDAIAKIAKSDAAGVTDELGNEACQYIIDSYPDCFTDSETMEKVMYCGFLLQYGYEDGPVGDLGQNVEQAVKYVYRGVETVDDDATQINLEQIEELLVEAGLLTPEASDSMDIETPLANDSASVGEKNALRSALSYLDYAAFSYTGLIGQLEFEGYTTEEATYAVDNCGADWKEEALQSALNYLDFSAFSYTGLIEQLEYEGFTAEEATYGANNCEADWMEQAVKCAADYLDYTAFSRQGLIDQLLYEGFTQEQAVYGVEENGL